MSEFNTICFERLFSLRCYVFTTINNIGIKVMGDPKGFKIWKYSTLDQT